MRNSRFFNGIHRLPRLTGMVLSHQNSGKKTKQEQAELVSNKIFSNIPMHISTIDKAGNVAAMATEECNFLNAMNGQKFTSWVNGNIHVQDRVALLHTVDVCQADKISGCVEFRSLPNEAEPNHPNWLELKCSAVKDDNLTIIVMRDISAQKTLEKQMQEAVEIADSTNLAKTRFLANMSHELRTPLNAIIGFSELLKSGMIPQDNHQKRTEYHGLIYDSAHHLLKVLNDILDMSKIEAGKYQIYTEEIEVFDSIEKCCNMLAPIADKAKVSLNYRCENEPTVIEADPRAVQQIIINLVSNAIKFSDENSVVTIDAKREGRSMVLTVKDDGCGMENHQLADLGQAFYQADTANNRHHEGTGLGLSIVSGLVTLHHGELSFESTVGKGTCASVKLPICQTIVEPVPSDEADSIIRISPQEKEKDLVQLGRLAGAGSNG